MTKIEQLELTIQDKAIHCAGCEARVQSVLVRIPGVEQVKAEYKTQRVQLTLDPEMVSVDQVRQKLENMGYKTAQ